MSTETKSKNEEQMMILQMLADGKINADQAERLLQALGQSATTEPEVVEEEYEFEGPPRRSHNRHHGGRHNPADHLEKMLRHKMKRKMRQQMRKQKFRRGWGGDVADRIQQELGPDGWAGFDDILNEEIWNFGDVIKFKMVGLKPRTVQAYKDLGLEDFDQDSIFALHALNIDPEYAAELCSTGLPKTSDDLIALGVHRIQADYIKQLQKFPWQDLSVGDVVEGHLQKIDADFLESLEWEDDDSFTMSEVMDQYQSRI